MRNRCIETLFRDQGSYRPRRIFALLKPGLFTGSYDRGYYGEMVTEAARTVFSGIGWG